MREAEEMAEREVSEKEIVVGVTTAPRKERTLAKTLASLQRSGFDQIRIFAEPESPVPDGYQTIYRKETLGPFRNWLASLKDLLRLGGDPILLCQDDIVMCRGVREFLARDLWPSPNTGVVSLYCSAKWRQGTGMIQIKKRNIWGCCALCIPRKVADTICCQRDTRQWRRKTHIDYFIGTVMRKLNLGVFAYNPSLVQHTGDKSTIPGHGKARGARRSVSFVGENYDLSVRVRHSGRVGVSVRI